MDFVSEDRAELSFLENTLLWSMRACAIGLGKRQSVDEPIRKVFTRLGAPVAGKQMQDLIVAIAHGAVRMIDLDCVCKPLVSDDEKMLIAFLALTQHHRFSEASSLLGSIVKPDAAATVLDNARYLMTSLHAAGRLLIPPLHLVTLQHLPAGGDFKSARQDVTLH